MGNNEKSTMKMVAAKLSCLTLETSQKFGKKIEKSVFQFIDASTFFFQNRLWNEGGHQTKCNTNTNVRA